MFLAHFFRFLRQWRAYGNSLQELSRLGDRELADIGISRFNTAASSAKEVQLPGRVKTSLIDIPRGRAAT